MSDPTQEVFVTDAMLKAVRRFLSEDQEHVRGCAWKGAQWDRGAHYPDQKDYLQWQRQRGPAGGDLAIMFGDSYAVKPGDVGVIEGPINGEEIRKEWQVCFGASAFRDHHRCSCSGGPSLYLPRRHYVATGFTRDVVFWRWNAKGAGGNNGVIYEDEVYIWIVVDPSEQDAQKRRQAKIRKGLPK